MVKRVPIPRRKKTYKGKGILGRVKKSVKAVFTKSKNTSSSRLQSTLASIGNVPITSIAVGRTPVATAIQGILTFLSAGKYQEIKKRLKYDDVYHCYLIIKLRNLQTYKLEKNHIVELTKLSSSPAAFPLSFTPPLTLQQLFATASSTPGFWSYDPAKNNCQNFVRILSHTNHLSPTSPQAAQCLQLQDADQLLKTLPGISKYIPKAVTSLASWGDRVLHGDE